MSAILHRLNIKRTVDEDDQIDLLFPKCKPKSVRESDLKSSAVSSVSNSNDDGNANCSLGPQTAHSPTRNRVNESKCTLSLCKQPTTAVSSTKYSGRGTKVKIHHTSASAAISCIKREKRMDANLTRQKITKQELYSEQKKGMVDANAKRRTGDTHCVASTSNSLEDWPESFCSAKGGPKLDHGDLKYINSEDKSERTMDVSDIETAKIEWDKNTHSKSKVSLDRCSLRDSRIEMAGGREVFSQSKFKVGRRLKPGDELFPLSGNTNTQQLPVSSVSQFNRKSSSPNTKYGGSRNNVLSPDSIQPENNLIWERNARDPGKHRERHIRVKQFGLPEDASKFTFRQCANIDKTSKSSVPIPRVYSKPGTLGLRKFKETVFDSDISCVEDTAFAGQDSHSDTGLFLKSMSSDIPKHGVLRNEDGNSRIYQGFLASRGEIVFDDIGDSRVLREDSIETEVKSSKIKKDGENAHTVTDTGNYVKDSVHSADVRFRKDNYDSQNQEEQLVSHDRNRNADDVVYNSSQHSDSFLNKSETHAPNSSSSRLIGNLQIAEYDGSPRRYGLNRQPAVTVSLPTDLDSMHAVPDSLVENCSIPTTSSSLSLDAEIKIITINNRMIPGPSFNQIRNATIESTSHTESIAGIRRVMPGFPQRVNFNSLTHSDDPAFTNERRGDKHICAGSTATESSAILASGNSGFSLSTCQQKSLIPLVEGVSPILYPRPVESNTDASTTTQSNSTLFSEFPQQSDRVFGEAGSELLYEFSETQKVLRDFFNETTKVSPERPQTFFDLDYTLKRQNGNSYVGQRLAGDVCIPEESPKKSRRGGGREVVMSLTTHESENSFGQVHGDSPKLISFHDISQNSSLSHSSRKSRPETETGEIILVEQEHDEDVETVSTGTETDLRDGEICLQVQHNFTPSPEITDCDSNDLESEISLDFETSLPSSLAHPNGSTMPVLEDGLSSERESESEEQEFTKKTHLTEDTERTLDSTVNPTLVLMKKQISEIEKEIKLRAARQYECATTNDAHSNSTVVDESSNLFSLDPTSRLNFKTDIACKPKYISDQDSIGDNLYIFEGSLSESELETLNLMRGTPPPSPAPNSVAPNHGQNAENLSKGNELLMKRKNKSDNGLNMEGEVFESPSYRLSGSGITGTNHKNVPSYASPDTALAGLEYEPKSPPKQPCVDQCALSASTNPSPVWVPRQCIGNGDYRGSDGVRANNSLRLEGAYDAPDEEADTDQETDRLLGQHRAEDDCGFYDEKGAVKRKRNKEDFANNSSVLIEGVLFRARYLGSTQLVCEGQPTKATRMLQAEEAVSRIKASDGEPQPSTEVDLFISTEKIMVLNTDLKEIMMDHALRTISYIADIGDVVVLMARRRPAPTDIPEEPEIIPRPPKMICHVFESDEAQYIAQSIGQAFQVAYMEFLKANGIEDHSFVREMDYQEVLNSQEIFGDELRMFAKKELQKDVVVPKGKAEILGVVIVESGWGSMLPTVVIANLSPAGAAARCGHLNIGDQIIAVNGVSLVGLPLSTCQAYIKNSKNQTVVKLTVVPCPPVVEVKIKRPDTKYQLGFSVQNGVICSLLRGGIAERGGVRVGHRIIEINNQSVVAVAHEKIVNLLATSVGEINMKTMPTSMFRLLTGQETPIYI